MPANRLGRAHGLLALGGVALALGALVYLTDRANGHASLLPALAAQPRHPLFGALGLRLPSFAHPFAFSLFSAAALQRRARPRYDACIAWLAINLAFEFGQHPLLKAPLAAALQDAPLVSTPARPLAHLLARYFLQGTFDPGDLAAAALGALAAALVLRQLHATQENRHGC